MRKLILLWVIVVCAVSGAEYCAIRVKTVAGNGNAIPAQVSVFSESGELIRTQWTSVNGETELCDLDRQKVSIHVGFHACQRTIIDRVWAQWPDELNLVALLNACVDTRRVSLEGAACVFHVRIKGPDSYESAVARVGDAVAPIDRFGRLWTRVPVDKPETIRVEIDGWASFRGLMDCKQQGGRHRDLKDDRDYPIVLTKLSK